MKKIKSIWIMGLCALLTVSCSAVPPEAAVTPGQPANSATGIVTQMPDTIEASDFVLTLIADDTNAVLNGQPVTLDTAPFIRDNAFFIPLESVVNLLGGRFHYEENKATVELWDYTIEYQLQKPVVIVDGISYEMTDVRLGLGSSTGIPVEDGYGPVEVNQTIFIPSDLKPASCPFTSLAPVSVCAESNMVILGGFDIREERGITDVKLYDRFEDLSVEFKNDLIEFGPVTSVLNYKIIRYGFEADKLVDIYVMRADTGTDDAERMDGRVCAIHVGGVGFRTVRGLEVADSAYRAWLLYGRESFTDSFYYRVENGLVTSFTFYTRYYEG